MPDQSILDRIGVLGFAHVALYSTPFPGQLAFPLTLPIFYGLLKHAITLEDLHANHALAYQCNTAYRLWRPRYGSASEILKGYGIE